MRLALAMLKLLSTCLCMELQTGLHIFMGPVLYTVLNEKTLGVLQCLHACAHEDVRVLMTKDKKPGECTCIKVAEQTHRVTVSLDEYWGWWPVA